MEHYSLPSSGGLGVSVLMGALWKQRAFVLLIASVVGCLSIAYALFAPAVYRSVTILYPTSVAQLGGIARSGVYDLSPASALSRVGVAMDSYEARSSYFKQWAASHLSASDDLGLALTEYNKSLRVVVGDSSTSMRQLKIEFDYPEGVDGAGYLDGYIKFVLSREADEINREIKAVIAHRASEVEQGFETARVAYQVAKSSRVAQLRESDTIRRAQLNDELKALRQQLKASRQNRISMLVEAEGIARNLGIQKLVTPADFAQLEGGGNVIRAGFNYNNNPLYFMGVEALQAERRALLARDTDEFTEPRIAQIARELSLLDSNREIQAISMRTDDELFMVETQAQRREMAHLQALANSVNVSEIAKIDKPAFTTALTVKPNRIAIIVFGIIFGVMIGMLVALVRFLIQREALLAKSGVTYESAAPLVQMAPGPGLVVTER